MIVWTYALYGHTPVLRIKLTCNYLSAMRGITLQGQHFLPMQKRAYKAEDVVRFALPLCKISDQLLVLWDGSPLHRAEASKQFLASPMGTVYLEHVPGNAPDLHPQALAWNVRKRRERKN